MRDVRQVLWGIITALVSIALLLGVFSLSLAEGNMQQPTSTLQPTASMSPTITPTWQPSPSQENSPTASLTLTPSGTPSLPPPPTNCPPPPGWLPYVVQPGDTLDGLAVRYKSTSVSISQANCLVTTGLLPGMVVYLPAVPTQTPIPCGPPRTWVIYIVQPGDTLYHLGQAFGVPYTDIQHANCMASSTLRTGQRLYVPPWATRTPSPTFPGIVIPSDTPTGTPTETEISVPPTDTGTPTGVPTLELPTTEVPTP